MHRPSSLLSNASARVSVHPYKRRVHYPVYPNSSTVVCQDALALEHLVLN